MLLLTGGSGLLGRELLQYMDVEAPSHEEFDVLQPPKLKNVEMIIHAAALTDVAAAEIQKKQYFATNTLGTMRLAQAYPEVPFVLISTEYVYNPVNFYSYTKLEAEKMVSTFAHPYLIIRTLFKETPFPYSMAFADQYTTGDYVDVIAPLVASKILRWNRKDEVVNIGTGRKTMYELAMKTRNVEKGSVDDIKDVRLPKDYE